MSWSDGSILSDSYDESDISSEENENWKIRIWQKTNIHQIVRTFNTNYKRQKKKKQQLKMNL